MKFAAALTGVFACLNAMKMASAAPSPDAALVEIDIRAPVPAEPLSELELARRAFLSAEPRVFPYESPDMAIVPRMDVGETGLVIRDSSELSERAVPVGLLVRVGVKLIQEVVSFIRDGIAADKYARSEFTQLVVRELWNQDPSFNYVICHTRHETRFDGAQGVDWYHDHQEFDIQIGGTIGYEIYGLRSGEFKRHGDGGFLNWAFIGNVVTRDQDGSRVVFARTGN